MTDSVQPPIRILYIDDDDGVARLVRRALEKHGYAVDHASNGAEGLRALQGGGYAVVGLDHTMPGEDGLAVLSRIMALPEHPPVVYVTGAEDSRIAVAALKTGAVDYVWKDVAGQFLELLAAAVRQALAAEEMRRAKERAERDVREARDRAELLLREVNHRVANSLSLVAALVKMQAGAITDSAAREALKETEARILAIGGIHRRLYTSDDVRFVAIDAYLASLVEELNAAMSAAGRDYPIRLDANPIMLATDKAVSLGVIATELVTNAYKYAYPSGSAGEIRLRIRRQADDLIFAVEDDGIGSHHVAAAEGTGLGTRIVKAMASNLRSTVDYDPDYPGTRVSLRFPL